MSHTEMIHTEQLRRTFKTRKSVVEAVTGIDLDIAPGELVAFLGPNGAGKTTTLRMLTTLLPPTSGRAVVAGADIVSEPARVRSRIGYIGQGSGAGHSFRVIDELLAQGRFYGMTSSDARARASELMGSLDLEALPLRRVSTLSGGQRRRLDIALGLMHRPRLLFLDEPSTGMDPHNRANLWEHILRLRAEQDATIVLTTHYLEEADEHAERVLVIDHGEIIADDTAGNLKARLAGDRITLTVAAADLDTAAGLMRDQAASPDVAEERRTDALAEAVVQLTARFDRGRRALPELIRRCGEAGVVVREADLRLPTLDDVFLGLTGRSLRETNEVAA